MYHFVSKLQRRLRKSCRILIESNGGRRAPDVHPEKGIAKRVCSAFNSTSTSAHGGAFVLSCVEQGFCDKRKAETRGVNDIITARAGFVTHDFGNSGDTLLLTSGVGPNVAGKGTQK
jgi:hypothetical protein